MQHNHRGDRTFTPVAMESTPTSAIQILSPQTQVQDKTGNHDLQFLKTDSAAAHPSIDLISILLVDDHALLREGLRQLLELEEDMEIVGEAVDGYDALQKIRQLQPGVVIMDIRLPMLDGIAITRQLTHEMPATAVLILTMYAENQHVLQAMKNGARGYLLKSASSQELVRAIRTVHQGGICIEPALTGTIVREYRRLSDSTASGQHIDALTVKEIEILRFVATGMSNKEIAARLAYSEKTVKNYLSTIFQKLAIRDRTQAAIFALRQGLLPEDW